MTRSHSARSMPSGARLAGALAVALLLGACSSVDLNRRYDPPPVRMPQPLPQAMPPVVAQPAPSAVVQATPVPTPSVVAPADAPNAHLVTFTTRVDGDNAMPPTRSVAVGQLDAIYDASTRLFRWKATWRGFATPITSIAFHGPGEMGQVAPVAMSWPGPYGNTYEGRATLTPEQSASLLEGRWYVNGNTGAFPTGEIRGQVRVVR